LGDRAAGVVAGREAWRGEVTLAGDVLVRAGSTLTLAAGTRVVALALGEAPFAVRRFGTERPGRGRCRILVEGELRAEGEPGAPVRAGGPGWGGIWLLADGRADLRALHAATGPDESLSLLDFARVRARDCRFEGADCGASVAGFARARFERCEFAGARRAGLRADGDAEVDALACASRAGVGLLLEDSARVRWLRGRVEADYGAVLGGHSRLRSSGSAWTGALAGLSAKGRSRARSRADRFAGPGQAVVRSEDGRIELASNC